MSFFKNIQNKSHQWKKKFALTVTIIIVFFIFIFWLTAIFPQTMSQIGKNDKAKEVVTEFGAPLQKVGYKIRDFITGIKNAFMGFSNRADELKGASTTASTTSSSTDLVQ